MLVISEHTLHEKHPFRSSSLHSMTGRQFQIMHYATCLVPLGPSFCLLPPTCMGASNFPTERRVDLVSPFIRRLLSHRRKITCPNSLRDMHTSACVSDTCRTAATRHTRYTKESYR